MNDVVVRLSQQTEQGVLEPKSTLLHVSEKAVESYFGLFLLMVCIAKEHPKMVDLARQQIFSFMAGKTDKESVPNVGHLLLAQLLTEVAGNNAQMFRGYHYCHHQEDGDP